MDRETLIATPTWNAGDFCVVCGSPWIQRHHVAGGTANRRKSDRYGYIIPLCANHHTGSAGIHQNRELDIYWKQTMQMHFEKHKGTREDFIREFGRSWL
jgi:hypothetical protein